jgi:F-type H+-transporting ATPase subunit gamma
MQTLESLRRHIDTAEGLQSIVRTMKSLSAVSIRQFENAAQSLSDYDRTVRLGLRAVLRQHHAPLGTEPRPGATAAIVFGSDHGLCGRFNEEIADFTWQRLRDLEVSPRACTMAAVGFRVASRLDARGVDLARVLELPGSAAGLTETVQTLAVDMDAWREARGVERILVFYNRRTDETFAEPRLQSLLPLADAALDDIVGQGWPSRMLPFFTMDADRLLSALLREYLFVGLYRAGAESMASEHASRLAAMQAAERNIEEHLAEVNAEYRRRRQQSITDEILDVVSGFESLQSEPEKAST